VDRRRRSDAHALLVARFASRKSDPPASKTAPIALFGAISRSTGCVISSLAPCFMALEGDMIASGFGLWRKTYCLEVEIGNQSPLRDRQHPIIRNRYHLEQALTKENGRKPLGSAEESNHTCIPTNYFRASIAAHNLHSLPASRNSTHKKASRTSPTVALTAGLPARPAVHQAAAVAIGAAAAASAAASARCSAPRAAAAEARPKCRSSRAATSRSTAAIASRSSAHTNR
jgi:hypothetical protein